MRNLKMSNEQFEELRKIREKCLEDCGKIYRGKIYVEIGVHNLDINSEVWRNQDTNVNKSEERIYLSNIHESINLYSEKINNKKENNE